MVVLSVPGLDDHDLECTWEEQLEQQGEFVLEDLEEGDVFALEDRHSVTVPWETGGRRVFVMVDELVWENAECFHAFFKSVLKIC